MADDEASPDEGEPTGPLRGFIPVVRSSFQIVATDLQIFRTFTTAQQLGRGEAANSVEIYGTALLQRSKVTLIGTDKEFSRVSLRLTNDADKDEYWNLIKRNQSIRRDTNYDNEAKRIFDLRISELDKKPPTATLFVTKERFQYNWSLECSVADDVLDRLANDIAGGLVSELFITINWSFGVVEPAKRWLNSKIPLSKEDIDLHYALGDYNRSPFGDYTLWGLFGLSAKSDPEPLWGHVTRTSWKIGNETVAKKDYKSESAYEIQERWREAVNKKKEEDHWYYRSSSALEEIGASVAKWIVDRNLDPPEFDHFLERAESFLKNVDDVINLNGKGYQISKGRLWYHYNVVDLMSKSNLTQREEYSEMGLINEHVDHYLSTPWLQCGYIDWLLLDSLVARMIVATGESFRNARFGMAYALSGGIMWKCHLWRIPLGALGIFLNWILPLLPLYYIYEHSEGWALGVGSIWYGLSVLWLVYWISHKVFAWISGEKSPLQRLILALRQFDNVYPTLIGPTLHPGAVRRAFQNAADAGIHWDAWVYHVLARISHTG